MASNGFPRSVFQPPSFHFQQYADEDVGLSSQHNLHHTDHMKRNSLYNALLIDDWRLDFFWLEILLQFLADKYRLQSSANHMTMITHLSSHRVSWRLLLERDNYSQDAVVFHLCFSLTQWNVMNKFVNGGIYDCGTLVKSGKDGA